MRNIPATVSDRASRNKVRASAQVDSSICSKESKPAVESTREWQPPEATPFCTTSVGNGLPRRQQRQRQRQRHPSDATNPSGAASHTAQRARQSTSDLSLIHI